MHQLTRFFPLISTPALIWALTLFKSPLLAASHSPSMVNYRDTYVYNGIGNITLCTSKLHMYSTATEYSYQ